MRKKKYGTARQVTEYNMARAFCMLDTKGYRHTLRICDTTWSFLHQQLCRRLSWMLRYTYCVSWIRNPKADCCLQHIWPSDLFLSLQKAPYTPVYCIPVTQVWSYPVTQVYLRCHSFRFVLMWPFHLSAFMGRSIFSKTVLNQHLLVVSPCFW